MHQRKRLSQRLVWALLGLLVCAEVGASCPSGSMCRPKTFLSESPSSQPSPQLLVFVSFSMPRAALQDLSQQVSLVGGALVFRGFISGSFQKTALKLKDLKGTVWVDPTLFEAYSVTQVPTFIFRAAPGGTDEKKVLDRLQGHVTLHHVLETFASRGDLKKEASRLLQTLVKAL